MKANQVRVGRFYVNEKKGLVREITNDTDNGDVQWQAYNLSDGTPSPGGSGLCSPYAIIQWADREATKEEISKLQIHAARTKEMKEGFELMNKVLNALPDELLIEEVRRRGFKVVKK